jgi:transcriptional regulator with XRE-family HTH domain
MKEIPLAERLKDLRESVYKNQKAMAEESGISFKNISKWETGRYIPNIFNCKKLANYFKITIDELLENVKED